MFLTRPISEHFGAFEANADSLEDIREFVQSALLESSLGRNATAGLLLAVEETVTNVIRHGYLYGPGRVSLRVRRTRRSVEIIVTDSGRPYEIDFDAKPDTAELARTGRRGGLGLMLVKKVTDDIGYQRQDDRNILTLVKHLHPVVGPSGLKGSMRRRTAIVASLGVAVAVAIGAFWVDAVSVRVITADFLARWTEFGRTAAASASQQMLNNRSDAEFDQLVVGLKSAHPELQYLIILDRAGRIRGDSENPERVHEDYVPPESAHKGVTGYWNVTLDGVKLFHFSRLMTVGERVVGSVAMGVGESLLQAQVAQRRGQVITWSGIILVIGELLVVLIVMGMARPLRRLGNILETAKSHGEKIPTPATAPDEVQEVLAAVNEMTEAVARTEKQMARQEVARRELEQAEQLQRALLPESLPEIPGYDAAAAYRMARQVGGDYYDLFPIGNGDERWVMIVADVAGKGFPAALVMTAVRTAARLLAPGKESPVEILAALNSYLERNHPGGPFVTAICAVLEPDTNRLTVASAGHTPALYRTATATTAVRVNPRGRPIGVGVQDGSAQDFGDSLSSWTHELGPGDAIVFYTDGISEASDAEGTPYGEDSIEHVFLDADGTAEETVRAVLDHFDLFTAGTPAHDDVTLMVLRRDKATPKNGNGHGAPHEHETLDGWMAHLGGVVSPPSGDPKVLNRLLHVMAERPEWSSSHLPEKLAAEDALSDTDLTPQAVEGFLVELQLTQPEQRAEFAKWAETHLPRSDTDEPQSPR